MPVYRLSKKKAVLFVGLAIILTVINLILIDQNKKLRAYIIELQQSSELKPGATVSELHGVDTKGSEVEIGYGHDARKTVILVFSPDCDYCTQNMPAWKKILSDIDHNSFRVVAVSLVAKGAKEYAAEHNLTSIPVIEKMYTTGADTYKMGTTPETILIDSSGRVERVWKGALDAELQKEVNQSLGVTF